MAQDIITPVGRMVQGGFKLQLKKDDNDKPVLKDDGTPVMETFIAIAVRKDDPDWPRFYGQLYAVAMAECAAYFDPTTRQCRHPSFSWKIKDGDGVDANGKSLADKPGFPGHWIINCTTQFMPRCYHEGKFGAHEEIQNPDEVIKRGYFVRAFLRVSGNGVNPTTGGNKKPGIFVSQQLVSLVGYGEVINTGPDAAAAFGGAPVAALPPGASATPLVGAGGPPAPGAGLAPPPMPGAALAPPVAPAVAPPPVTLPPPVAAVPPPPPVTLPPPAPTGPTYVMTAKAMGATREQLIAANWTDAALLEHGMMVQT